MNYQVENNKEYHLQELLLKLWQEGEGFSGKRPFGNSGWEYDLLYPLVAMGEIPGKLDDDGCLESINGEAGYEMVESLIYYVFSSTEK